MREEGCGRGALKRWMLIGISFECGEEGTRVEDICGRRIRGERGGEMSKLVSVDEMGVLSICSKIDLEKALDF